MRKFAASLLSVALLLSLTACGRAETDWQENTQAGKMILQERWSGWSREMPGNFVCARKAAQVEERKSM